MVHPKVVLAPKKRPPLSAGRFLVMGKENNLANSQDRLPFFAQLSQIVYQQLLRDYMTTYETLIPLSDLLQRGEAVQAGELIGFDSADGVQWCYFSHMKAGIACLRISPDSDSENDPAMLAEHCFIQRPAVLVTDIVAMLQKNMVSMINELQTGS